MMSKLALLIRDLIKMRRIFHMVMLYGVLSIEFTEMVIDKPGS